MFDQIFGNLEGFQERIRETLASMPVEASSPDGKIRVRVNALRQVLDISVEPGLEPEQLEDLLVLTLNQALTEAARLEMEESAKMMKELLPPGLGALSGLFPGK